MIKTKEDLTGQRFGRLVVLEQAEDHIQENGKHIARWWCQCDCGSEPVAIIGNNLTKTNGTKSCGCIMRENAATRCRDNPPSKKYNTYDLTGEYGIGWTIKGVEFWFDLEDYDKIKNYCWHYTDKGYIREPGGKSLHRIVMNAQDGDVIDHIQHPKKPEPIIDNRKQNLRFVTFSQNNMNQHLRSDNISNTKGVWFDKTRNKWVAEIKISNRKKFLGRFVNLDDAIRARKEAEDKYFGEYSYDYSQQI